MEKVDSILKDHQRKSAQVKLLRRKLKNKAKNSISLEVLKEMLAREESKDIDYRDYESWGQYDESGYMKDDTRRSARIELLKEIIRLNGN